MKSEPHLHVVLVEPEIPPNTGSIGRLCAITCCRLHLIEPLGFTIDDKSLKRAGMDYWQYLDWCRWPNLEALQAEYPASRFFYFTTKTKRLYTDIAFQRGDFLVFGRETCGLPASLIAKNESRCVCLPMLHPEVRSLNLATAVAGAVYEGVRQLGCRKV